MITLRQSVISPGVLRQTATSSRGTTLRTREYRDNDRLIPELWIEHEAITGSKITTVIAIINFRNIKLFECNGARTREKAWRSFIFSSRTIIPREILPRDSATVLLQPQSNSMQFLLSLSFCLLPPSAFLSRFLLLSTARSRPLRRGSISTMIVIHVRYNRKLAAAT